MAPRQSRLHVPSCALGAAVTIVLGLSLGAGSEWQGSFAVFVEQERAIRSSRSSGPGSITALTPTGAAAAGALLNGAPAKSERAACPSLSSSVIQHVNSREPYSLVDASPEITGNGVVAESCKVSGWNYVLALPKFDRRGTQWFSALFDAVMGKSKPTRCGYDWKEILHNIYPRSPCDAVVDVGGNIGLSVTPALSRGWRTIVFEPVPRNVEVLRLNIFLNGWGEDLVNLMAAAASNFTGQADIFVPKGREDNTAFGSAKTATKNVGGVAEAVTVRMVKLDDYFAGADPGLRDSVRLVKIDTQGHELSVLQGMREFLSTGPRQFVVLVEIDKGLQKLAGHGPDDIPNFMAELGWKPYCPGGKSLIPGRNCYDVLFKHD